MIKSFSCKDTEKLFYDKKVSLFRAIELPSRSKLLYLHSCDTLGAVGFLPGSRLEQLKGDRKGQFSIRINQKWRICFNWLDGDAYNVEIVDYH